MKTDWRILPWSNACIVFEVELSPVVDVALTLTRRPVSGNNANGQIFGNWPRSKAGQDGLPASLAWLGSESRGDIEKFNSGAG
jgi:hypothetical protein